MAAIVAPRIVKKTEKKIAAAIVLKWNVNAAIWMSHLRWAQNNYMKLKLNKANKGWINVIEMQDGDIAIIREHSSVSEYVGRIVQRHEYRLITIGERMDLSWPSIFTNKKENLIDFTVELLKVGDCIEIVDN